MNFLFGLPGWFWFMIWGYWLGKVFEWTLAGIRRMILLRRIDNMTHDEMEEYISVR